MKRFLSFFTVFIFINLNAQNNLSYSIKLGTYKYLKNAQEDREKASFDTYIVKGKKFYSLYTGSYKNKNSAKKILKQLKKYYKSAYITAVKVNKKTINHDKIIKVKKIRTVKKDPLKIAKGYYQIGVYEKALTKFDQILINEPDNNLARLEYARTLFKLGFYKDATEEFKTVLKANPPKTVQNNINSYLKKIKSMSRKNYFYGSIGIDLTYDDNLGFNTYLPTTMYGGLELQNDTNRTKGFYENLNISISHLYVGKYFNWNNIFYSYNEFQNEDIDNLNFLGLYSTLSKKYTNFKVLLPFGINKSWLDGKSYNHTVSFNPEIQIEPDNKTQIAMNIKLQSRQFSKNDEKSFQTYGTKLSLIKLFDKLTLYANCVLENDVREKTIRYDVSRHRILISTRVYYQLLKNSQIHFGYLYNFDKYNIIDPVLGFKREDTKSQYSASYKQQLSKNSSTTFSYNKLINDSNINAYSYKKNSYSFSYRHDF
jgi:hypothetical protein